METIKENYIFQAWLVLILCLIFGASLSGIQLSLSPKILENKKNETLRKIPELVLGESYDAGLVKADQTVDIRSFGVSSGEGNKKKSYPVYEVKDKNGSVIGYVSRSSGPGYADKIEILAGFDSRFETLTGLFILDQKETPGLGNKIIEKKWRNQFSGKKTAGKLIVMKNGAKEENEIDAITGATISSRSVTDIVNNMVADLKEPMDREMADQLKDIDEEDDNGN